MPRLLMDIAWQVEGPFLTAGIEALPGLDASFNRAADGTLAVRDSHVKGKLREAARLLAEILSVPTERVDWWLGSGGDVGNQGERVHFSDARVLPEARQQRSDLDCGPVIAWEQGLGAVTPGLVKFGGSSYISRTAIGASGTALAHTLRVEESQPRGQSLWWNARADTAGPDGNELKALARFIAAAARGIVQFGSDKGVGYGQIRNVVVSAKVDDQPIDLNPGMDEEFRREPLPEPIRRPAIRQEPQTKRPPELVAKAIAIVPLEPVYIAAVKRPGTHFQQAADHVPGAALKGAIASALNLEWGLPLSCPIGVGHPAAEAAPDLVAHFEYLRCLHAYPRGPGRTEVPRPFVVPLSAFADGKAGERVWDAALTSGTGLCPDDGGAPRPRCYAPDTRLPRYVTAAGAAGETLAGHDTAFTSTTRTAIDPDTLRAAEEQLFGYEQMAEVIPDEHGWTRQVFVTEVRLPDDGQGLAARIWEQLVAVLPHLRLGKSNARLRVYELATPRDTLRRRLEDYGDRPLIFMLGSDTLLDLQGEIGSSTNLTAHYADAWRRALRGCGWEVAGREFMSSVFARQALRGGWSGRRAGGMYRCYTLTCAGSVFVTNVPAREALEQPQALSALRQLEGRGMQLSGDDENLRWTDCSYVPENGYGEVIVCHPWHLRRLP